MSKSELNENRQISLMVSGKASSGYLRARNAGVEVTVLEGREIVRIQGDQRTVVGSIPSSAKEVNKHYVIR